MSSNPPAPPSGVGRGGRGALILAAVQNQARRPGETPSSSSNGRQAAALPVSTTATPSAPVAMGRGAMLRALVAQSKAGEAQTPVPSPTPVQTPTPPVPSQAPPPVPMGRAAMLAAAATAQGAAPRPMGRGALLSMAVKAASVSSVSSSPAPSPIPSVSQYRPSYPPPIPIEDEMEKLEIGKYSSNYGKRLDLDVNFVKINVKQGMGVFEYHVTFTPQVDSDKARRKIIGQPHVREITGAIKTFDGAKLYLPRLLPDEVTTFTATHPFDESEVSVSMKYVGQNQGQGRIQLYNVLFRKIMNTLKLTLIGRNFFDPSGGIPVPQHKLQIWPGYVQAIQDFEGGLMLNCDVSFRVLRTQTAKDLLYDAYCRNKATFQDEFFKQVIGCVVLTRYNNKTYRVDDVAWDSNPESTFMSHSGQEITYKKYYKDAYGIDVQDLGQPLLINKPRRKAHETEDRFICLIPELCSMTGLTDNMRNDFKVMKDISVHTRVTPNQRQAALKKYCENINNCTEAKQILTNWGLELDPETVQINGRMLDAETIILANQYQFSSGKEADWGRELSRAAVLRAVDLENWLVLVTKRDEGKGQDFVNTIKRMGPQMGVNISQPTVIVLENDRTETFLRFTRDRVHPGVQMVVFIFPTSRDDRYSAVKKLCCVDMPVPSQVINARTISQPQKLRSVTQKIALQMNCKLGGELWAVSIPMKSAMVCGVDTYHDPSRGGRSVLGFVASLNSIFTRWFSICTFQEKGQELGDCLRIALLAALRKFDDVNHFLPKHIIVFRDGVGDGQMKHVTDYEVQQLEASFGHFVEGYQPKLTVIVVQKKINTKIFLKLNSGGRGNDQLDNPPPGTVVDHTVTKKNWFDFFLVSQHVRQGTVNPTHYVVVHNRSDLQPTHLQKLSYKLTHLYYNWPGTIRVPAPCQYAHKLAYLCGQNIHKEAHPALSDKLFFL